MEPFPYLLGWLLFPMDIKNIMIAKADIRILLNKWKFIISKEFSNKLSIR